MQTAVATQNANRQTISRTRSSVRCSTRLSRSSWLTGRRADAMAGRRAVSARRALAHVAFHGGGLVLGAPGRGRCLGTAAVARGRLAALVVAVLARDRVLELAHAVAELLAQPRQALGAEDEQHDHQHDDQLSGSDAVEHVSLLTRGAQ